MGNNNKPVCKCIKESRTLVLNNVKMQKYKNQKDIYYIAHWKNPHFIVKINNNKNKTYTKRNY